MKLTRVDKAIGKVISVPIVEMESPFYLSFMLSIDGKTIPATFIGDFARALRNNIRVGDNIIVRDGLNDNGHLVFDFIHMEEHTAVGRSVNAYA